MEHSVDVAILGAGTAGLSALAEVIKAQKSALIIDPGPLGTTCARTGCMPSKIFIQIANDYHRRFKFATQGITGSESLKVDLKGVMKHVRHLRDRFVSGVLKDVAKHESILIRERGHFLEPGLIAAGDHRIRAKHTIIATGSRPVLLPEAKDLGASVLTSDNFFEQEDLPSKIGVIGVGVIGAELGQAMSRLGLNVSAYNLARSIGGLTDPAVQDVALDIFASELDLRLGAAPRVEREGSKIKLVDSDNSTLVDALFISIGRKANLEDIGLENIDFPFDERGRPIFDSSTMQVNGQPIYIAGDVNSDRPLLHEAADEGRIAGYNSVSEETRFCRRIRLSISFTSPNIAMVGASFTDLSQQDYAVGEVRFEGQGRSIIKQENRGILRIYADRKTGIILGSEMIAPDAEHLAHLIAAAIQRKTTIREMLQMPFYHPVVEEGLRTALRNLNHEVGGRLSAADLALCNSSPFSLG